MATEARKCLDVPTFTPAKKGKVVDNLAGVRKEELQRMIEKCRN
jgi:hypothetical protein